MARFFSAGASSERREVVAVRCLPRRTPIRSPRLARGVMRPATRFSRSFRSRDVRRRTKTPRIRGLASRTLRSNDARHRRAVSSERRRHRERGARFGSPSPSRRATRKHNRHAPSRSRLKCGVVRETRSRPLRAIPRTARRPRQPRLPASPPRARAPRPPRRGPVLRRAASRAPAPPRSPGSSADASPRAWR